MGNWELPPKGGHMESPNGLYLQTMNMTQINERLKTNDLIIIPVGSTECHGAGQPLGEDTFLVTRAAEQVAMKMGCTIAHPIWYSSHPHNHLGMPGTIVVPEDVLLANMRAIITGLWNTGFRKQIFVNGHGQEEVLPLAIQQWQKKYQLPAVLITLHTWTVIHDHMKDRAHGGAFDMPFAHADEAEASYSLALFPEFMDPTLFVDNKLKDHLKGPLAFVAGQDPVTAAKVVVDFAKDNQAFKIMAGSMGGKLMSTAEMTALAKLPSREVLLATLMGTMQAPVQKFVATLNEVPAKFVRALAAIRDQKQAAA